MSTPSAGNPAFPTIPDVEIEARIGQGGMGVVFRGRQPYLDRLVAVKLLPLAISHDNPKFVERFQREAKLLAGLHHPNIVICHQAGTTQDGACYLVMEHVDGPNLRQWIEKNGPLTQYDALDVLHGLIEALAYAQEKGIIHRDVKPENVLLAGKTEKSTRPTGPAEFHFVAKLVDLGLARPTKAERQAEKHLTAVGTVMGTPATMSPEQFNDPDSVDYRTDIYGLGCILYHAVVGEPAFNDPEMMKIIQRKIEGEVPSPRQVKPELRTEIDLLVKDMLQPDRNRRPSYPDLLRRCDNLRKNLAFSRRPTSGAYTVLPPAEGAAARSTPPAGSPAQGDPTMAAGAQAPPDRSATPRAPVGSARATRPVVIPQVKLTQDPVFWMALVLFGAILIGGIGSLVVFTKMINAERPTAQGHP